MLNENTLSQLGYDRNLIKGDKFYDRVLQNNIENQVLASLLGSGEVSIGILKSPNFVSGSAGCKIDFPAGTAEFQTIVAGDYIKIFVQDAIPTSLHINDIWYDSNDDNKSYRAACVGADQITAGEWERVDNPTEWADVLDGDSHKPEDDADVTSANNQGVAWLNESVGSELPTANTAAKCTDANADQTSAHDCQHPGDYTASHTANNANNYTGNSIATSYTAAKCTDANADQTSAHDCQHPGDYTLNATAITDANISSINFNNISASNISATSINTGILTARLVRTAASGHRVELNPTFQTVDLYNINGILVGEFDGVADGLNIRFNPIDKVYWSSGIGYVSFEIHEQIIKSRTIIPLSNNGWDLGSSSYKFRKIYAYDAHFYDDVNIDDELVVGDGLTLGGVRRTTWPSGSAFSCSDLNSCDIDDIGTKSSNATFYFGNIYTYHHYPRNGNTYDLGSSATGYRWRKLWVYDIQVYDDLFVTDCIYVDDDVYPNSDNSSSSLGFSTRYFNQLYANMVRYKSLSSFQHHNDIQLIKDIKTKIVKIQKPHTFIKEKGKLDGEIEKVLGKQIDQEVWDENTMPKETYEDGFYDAGAVSGLTIGALKQLIEKVETLEKKIETIELK